MHLAFPRLSLTSLQSKDSVLPSEARGHSRNPCCVFRSCLSAIHRSHHKSVYAPGQSMSLDCRLSKSCAMNLTKLLKTHILTLAVAGGTSVVDCGKTSSDEVDMKAVNMAETQSVRVLFHDHSYACYESGFGISKRVSLGLIHVRREHSIFSRFRLL